MAGPIMRPQIVLFGSSIIQMSFDNGGWGAILANLYARKADIILRGYSGWNSRRALEVLDEIFPKDAYVQPSLVIVYFGGNDSIDPHPSGLGPHVPLEEYVENMRKIANHLKSLSDHIRIIFLTSPPINEELIRKKLSATQSGRTNESCGEYADGLMELCEEMNIKAINLWSAIQTREDWLDVSFTDGVHLSAEGSKVVVKEILKVLREVDWKPSLHWMSMPTEYAEDSPYYPPSPDGTTTINVSHIISRRQALDVLDKVFPKESPVQPSLLIVYFGGNDSVHPHPSGLGPHVPLEEYVENMRKIANHLKSLSDHIRIIFLTSPPINEEQIRKKLSATQSGRTNESCRDRDEVHLSAEGNKVVVKEILKVLRKSVKKKQEYIIEVGSDLFQNI
ncbi:GDSL esterase/lipase CPRD49 [Glycine max]|nr:GDSL esterase/lipase CPRD49 [Glycine max]